MLIRVRRLFKDESARGGINGESVRTIEETRCEREWAPVTSLVPLRETVIS